MPLDLVARLQDVRRQVAGSGDERITGRGGLEVWRHGFSGPPWVLRSWMIKLSTGSRNPSPTTTL
jgi:hypothetical protein